jgi:hypothetical protein
MKLNLILTIVLVFMMGCKKDEVLGDQTSDSIEAGISALADIADEENDESFASNTKNPILNFFDSLQIQKAYSAACSARAGLSSCTNGVRAVEYVNCTIPSTNQTLNGDVTLTYSDSGCSMSSNGNTVTRSYNYTRTTSWGAVITTTSTSQSDYNGDNYGGGGVLTKTISGFNMVLNGKHKHRTTSGGRSAFDLSLKTSSAISVSALDRSTRVIDGGSLLIANNNKEYTIAMSPNSLTYTSNCCYPTGGSIDVTISGSVNATGSVAFNSCGNATLTKNGVSVGLSLYSCE